MESNYSKAQDKTPQASNNKKTPYKDFVHLGFKEIQVTNLQLERLYHRPNGRYELVEVAEQLARHWKPDSMPPTRPPHQGVQSELLPSMKKRRFG